MKAILNISVASINHIVTKTALLKPCPSSEIQGADSRNGTKIGISVKVSSVPSPLSAPGSPRMNLANSHELSLSDPYTFSKASQSISLFLTYYNVINRKPKFIELIDYRIFLALMLRARLARNYTYVSFQRKNGSTTTISNIMDTSLMLYLQHQHCKIPLCNFHLN